jgi:hypothetical protein
MVNNLKEVPFTKDGMQVSEYGWAKPENMVPNVEQTLTLKFVNYTKGRSAVGFTFQEIATGLNYNFTLGEWERMTLHSKNNINGVVAGVFMFKKKGSTYTLSWVRD